MTLIYTDQKVQDRITLTFANPFYPCSSVVRFVFLNFGNSGDFGNFGNLSDHNGFLILAEDFSQRI
jgi:hypothetical protein